MNKVLATAVVLGMPWLSGSALGAEPPSAAPGYAVVGFRTPGGLPVAELVSQFREELARRSGGRAASVQSEAATKASLGLSTAPTAVAIKRIGDAEGDYQQYLLDSARAKFEAGLQELVGVGGEEGVWESTVTARVLLGMVHLAGKDREAQKKAQAEFESILRVYPTFQAMGHSDDPIVLALFDKARAKVSREPAGELAVSCSTPCPNGFVWVNQAPRGRVNGPAIKLPVGTYRVRVTDRQDAPHLFSFNHEVQIQEGGKSALLVDLESEGALDLGGGPAFAIAAEPERRLNVLKLVARRLQRGKIAALWLDDQYVHLAVSDAATGAIERHAAVALPAGGKLEGPCRELAQFAVGGEPPPPAVLRLPPLLEARPLPPPPAPTGPRPWAIAQWSALGTAAALGVAAGVVAASANSDLKKINDRYTQLGKQVPPLQVPQYISDANAVLRKQNLRNGLFIGAGACAAASAAFFAIDRLTRADAVSPEPRAADGVAPLKSKPATALSFEARLGGFALVF
jgi:hypothetical protein